MNIKRILTVAALILLPMAAQSASLGIVEGKQTGRTYITITGNIDGSEIGQLKMMKKLNPKAEWVAFNSPGGLARAGYELGNTISRLGLNTYVGYGQACVSACYIAFLGGAEYDVDGVLAAHNAWLPDTGDITVNKGMQLGQQIASYDMIYHLLHGFNASLAYAIAINTDKDTYVTFTDEKDLMEFFARSERDVIQDYLSAKDIGKEWKKKHVTETKDIFYKANINLERDASWLKHHPRR